MTTRAAPIVDILRPLAESEDNRFEALRRPARAPTSHSYARGQSSVDAVLMSPGIDASFGAIVRAAAACGSEVLIAVMKAALEALEAGQEPEEPSARALAVAVDA